ncbi:MAG: DUF2079 domain-containing protein [Myxococcota bacterium]
MRRAGLGFLSGLLVLVGLVMLEARGGMATLGAVSGLGSPSVLAWSLGVLAFGLGLRARAFARPTVTSALGALLILVLLVGFAHPLGRHLGLFGAAVVLAVGIIDLLPARQGLRMADGLIGAGLFMAAFVPMCIFSMHRHWAFGSGSWDLGCIVHIAFLSSRWLPPISTVLGDVGFLADHFLPAYYLWAPLFWIDDSAYTVLALQAAHLACVGPAVFSIARHHGASKVGGAAVGLATGLSFGLQSGAFFDAHGITMGFGFFAWGLWAMETGRFRLASALLGLFCLSKESVPLYLCGLGLWVLLVRRDPRARFFGGAWVIAGSAAFVLVTQVLMPALAVGARPPVSHETFADFGPNVGAAALGILSDPIRALFALFVPEPKLASLIVTFAGVGWLCFGAPSVLVAALPLLAERFLSTKTSMWKMGYHYAAPLCLYAGWGAARCLSRLEARLALPWTDRVEIDRQRKNRRALAIFVLLMSAGTLGWGYRHPANFLVWRYAYYAEPTQARANRAILEAFRAEAPAQARVAAQNHLLPHVADRRFVWRLGEWSKADWILLATDQDAWPQTGPWVARLDQRLRADPNWRVVAASGQTALFARQGAISPPSSSGPD